MRYGVPTAPLVVVTRARQAHCYVVDATARRIARAWDDDARGWRVTSQQRMSQVSKINAQARMTAAATILSYLHGDGSQTPRDTAGHATEIAHTLGAAGLLIDPSYQVAITPERLNELKHAEETLAALAAAGVDNWEGYDDAVAEIHSVDEDAKFG